MRLAKISLQCVLSLIVHRSRVTQSIESLFGFSNKRCLQMAQFFLISTITTLCIVDGNISLHSGQSNRLPSNSRIFSFGRLPWLLLVHGARRKSPLRSHGDLNVCIWDSIGESCLSLPPRVVLWFLVCCSNGLSKSSRGLYCCRYYVKRLK